MSLDKSYDESEEIVKTKDFTKGQTRLTDTAIVCFKKELIDEISNENVFEEYSTINVGGDNIKIYKINVENKEVVLYRSLMGAPATVAMMEEMHARGVNKFIFFGSCGELTPIQKETFIIPEEAYRDEGTSYHYLPDSDFVKVKTAKKLAEIFEKNNIKYELTRTWTTDALYKETVEKTKNRVKLGCKVVEMECAAIMAAAETRNIEAYQFLYTDDSLNGEIWDIRTLADNRLGILKKCLQIATEIAKET